MKPFNHNTSIQTDRSTKVKLPNLEILFGTQSDMNFVFEAEVPRKVALIKQRQSRATRRHMRRSAFGF